MAFCNSCGFLLPTDFHFKNTKDILCNACLQLRSSSKGSKLCDCEFCQNPLGSCVQDSIQDNNSLAFLDSSSESFEDEKSMIIDDNDTLPYSSQPYNHDKITPYDWGSDLGSCQWDDHETTSDVKLTATSSINTCSLVMENEEEKNEEEWTLVSPRGSRVSPRDSRSQKADTGIKNSENQLKKEDQVSEEIREKWTREQAEYLEKLITEDIPVIEILASGERRKPDGSHFYIGGVDISFIKNNKIDACACLSVVQMPSLKLVYQRMEMIKLTQPYIPGFLAFREVPPLLTLFTRLKKAAPHFMPDVVMVDGNGILHPRGFGLASQLGVDLDLPTIGVAKTLMNAQGVTDDAEHKRRKQSLKEACQGFDLISETTGKAIGRCLRVHDDAINPVYVSIGHKISLSSASWIVLETSKYRIPEPVRRADLDSREYIRQNKKRPEEFILPRNEI